MMLFILALQNLMKQSRAKDFPVDVVAAQLNSHNRSCNDHK